ncbi:MAG: hypothetical protein HZB47_04895 [Nitrosomonadales bacterium]|nr:hypothetical protein [Nitrosomonadales bacterium]
MKARMLVLALCGAFAAPAQAEGLGVYVNGGTTGFGLGLAGVLTDGVTGRLSFDTWKRTVTQSDSNGNYNLDLKLQTINMLADWYPFGGAFRTTLGLVSNGNKATLTATPSATGTYTFNGVPYSTADVGAFNGEVKFNSTAPYLGIGWGNPVAKGKSWGFVTDIGVLFQGSPKVNSTVTCSATLLAQPGGAAACDQMKADVAAGATKLESDIKDFKYYPVISFGVSYNF